MAHQSSLAYIMKKERWEEMELSKKADGHIKYPALEGKEDLRFELFDWLKEKGLSVRQAVDLLAMTRGEIIEARRKEMDDMKL